MDTGGRTYHLYSHNFKLLEALVIALIDMDLVVYRCAASAENESLDIAKHRVDELLDNILTKVEATEYKAFLSSSTNFRKTIYPEYKANRTQTKPKWLSELRDYALTIGAVVAKDGLEADDELGISQKDNTIICSLDKDLLQIQGNHFQWQIEGGTPDKRWVKPDRFTDQPYIEGLRLFYEQCLKGDSSDNVKGAKGIGEKRATKLLKDCKTEKEMIEVCLGEYFTEEEFLMNAQCLYVLRSYDDNYIDRFTRIMK